MGKEEVMTGNNGGFCGNDIISAGLPQGELINIPVGKKTSTSSKLDRLPPFKPSGNCTLLSLVVRGVTHGGT